MEESSPPREEESRGAEPVWPGGRIQVFFIHPSHTQTTYIMKLYFFSLIITKWSLHFVPLAQCESCFDALKADILGGTEAG